MARSKKRKTKRKPIQDIPIISPNSAGIDLGATQHFACAPSADRKELEVRSFGTTTPQLLKLAEWLRVHKVDRVAMESTSVYWIPIFEILEKAGFSVILANARQLHQVPGRKTDVLDCQWIQRLHSCGLLRGSFRPKDEVCCLRALMRQSSNYIQLRTQATQWMQKALDQMNIQAHRAVTDITGVTGMKIIRAIVEGERDPKALAEFRDRRCKKSVAEIAEHLTGNWRDEHLFNLAEALELYDFVNAKIDRYERKFVDELNQHSPKERQEEKGPMHPNPKKEKAIAKNQNISLRDSLWRFSGLDLTRIDGVNVGVASATLVEVGPDLTSFPSEGDFVSWLRLCPRRPVSGGKVLKKKANGTGATRLGSTFRHAAISLRNSSCALGAEYRRIARRKGAAVAVFVIARKIATLVYRMLRHGQDYFDIGAESYERQFAKRRFKRALYLADEFGYDLVPKVKPA